jgi:hypothetical protein
MTLRSAPHPSYVLHSCRHRELPPYTLRSPGARQSGGGCERVLRKFRGHGSYSKPITPSGFSGNSLDYEDAISKCWSPFHQYRVGFIDLYNNSDT